MRECKCLMISVKMIAVNVLVHKKVLRWELIMDKSRVGNGNIYTFQLKNIAKTKTFSTSFV